MIHQRIAEYLNGKGIAWHAHGHPRRVSAQETAAVEHISGKQFAKTVVLDVDGRFVLAMLPAHLDVDLARLGGELGDARLAPETSFAERFPGCEVGAMPPLGELYGIEVVMDESLTRQPFIVFNGGTHEDSIQMATDDFMRLAPVRVLELGRPGWERRKRVA